MLEGSTTAAVSTFNYKTTFEHLKTIFRKRICRMNDNKCWIKPVTGFGIERRRRRNRPEDETGLEFELDIDNVRPLKSGPNVSRLTWKSCHNNGQN